MKNLQAVRARDTFYGRHQNTHADDVPNRMFLPLGHSLGRREFGADLAARPHVVITGNPGLGKTNALGVLTAAAIRRCYSIRRIRGGLADYVTAHLFQDVHTEVARRRQILEQEGAASWADLEKDADGRERLLPLLVIVDGAMRKAYRSSGVLVGEHAERIAAEAPGAGVHLAITREPWAFPLGDALRSQSTEIELTTLGTDSRGNRIRHLANYGRGAETLAA